MSGSSFSIALLLSMSLFTTAFAEGVMNMPARSPIRIDQLRCEGLSDPLGIDAEAPRLTWQMECDLRNQMQSAYQILVASSPEMLSRDEADQWNSGRVGSGQSIQVGYKGAALESGKKYFWKVRVWDREGRESDWSRIGMWTTGLLKPGDWKAKWIGLDGDDDAYHLTMTQWIWYPGGQPDQSAPVGTRYFRRVFVLPGDRALQKALWYVTADDEAEFFLNGVSVCSTKSHRVLTEINLTQSLRAGTNILAVAVRNAGTTPNPAGLVGMLDVRFADGSSLRVPTDFAWKAADAVTPGWQSAAYDDRQWVEPQILGPVGMAPWGEKSKQSDRRLPARWIRKDIKLDKPVSRATVYLSGLGLSELYINGKKVGDHVLSPALSEYPKRVFYVTHDVSAALTQGRNALGVVLGNGRYFAPRLGEPTTTQSYGYPKVLLQLHLEFKDGTSANVLSDETWKLTTDGPIPANNEYDGEEYDARKELDGWASPGYDDSKWEKARGVSAPAGALRAQMIRPIRVVETIRPLSVKEQRPGVFIVDMGQNIVGWCRIRVNGPRGTLVFLRHAETLKPDGELYMDNLRSARVTDIYTLKGQGIEVYEPRFTYHGFRFVEVTGFPGTPDSASIEGRVVNDDVESAGDFACSHPVINTVYKAVVRGVQGNYRSIPTDCPQRDERQGWLGDRSAESRGESFLFDISSLYAKWVQDMADAQQANGSVSDVCPSYWPLYNDNVTWPSSTVIIPGTLLDQYADSALIRQHYPSMVRWIDHMSGYIKEGIIEKDNYGDWCVPPESPELIHSKDPMRKTAPGILATSYFYHDLMLMNRYATLVGNEADARRFSALARTLRDALNQRYFNETNGYYDNGSQTSCVLPLAFNMVPAALRARVFGRLIQKITDESKYHIGTGLIGGQWLNRVLADFGRADLVFRIATNTTYPSWGYMTEKGATTIWELWNGDSADPAMNSGNHVMLVGDLVIWLYERLAGIMADSDEPGFKHIIMRPTPLKELTVVRATHKSPHGLIESAWKQTAGRFEWDVRVPVNSRATVYVPAKNADEVMESGTSARNAAGVRYVRTEGYSAVLEVTSGVYHFTSQLPD
ncbi:MAG TPA: glycoside hydrolase family 78 protein [Bacteroidota bacterium]|nr:glycoside hydrolase family 78 protein [Bacteroidota bacterium]